MVGGGGDGEPWFNGYSYGYSFSFERRKVFWRWIGVTKYNVNVLDTT